MNLDVGLALVVQLTPAEARGLIPQLKLNLGTRMGRLEKEVREIEVVKSQFDGNFTKLQLALNPLLKDLESLSY